MKHREIYNLLDAELARYPDVTYEIAQGRTHIKVWLCRDNRRSLITMSSSVSDYRAILNQRKDVRRTLRHLGLPKK